MPWRTEWEQCYRARTEVLDQQVDEQTCLSINLTPSERAIFSYLIGKGHGKKPSFGFSRIGGLPPVRSRGAPRRRLRPRHFLHATRRVKTTPCETTPCDSGSTGNMRDHWTCHARPKRRGERLEILLCRGKTWPEVQSPTLIAETAHTGKVDVIINAIQPIQQGY